MQTIQTDRLLARLGLRETGEGMYALRRDEWLARGAGQSHDAGEE